MTVDITIPGLDAGSICNTAEFAPLRRQVGAWCKLLPAGKQGWQRSRLEATLKERFDDIALRYLRLTCLQEGKLSQESALQQRAMLGHGSPPHVRSRSAVGQPAMSSG